MKRPRNIQFSTHFAEPVVAFLVFLSLEFLFVRFDPQDYGAVQSNPTSSCEHHKEKTKQHAGKTNLHVLCNSTLTR